MAFGYDPGPQSDRGWETLESIEDVPVGARIRATLSWDACSTQDQGQAPIAGPPAGLVDLDLFLLSPELDKYIWASQSLSDNNEGFDYTIQAADVDGGSGPMKIIMAWPKGELNCEGSDQERYGFTWVML